MGKPWGNHGETGDRRDVSRVSREGPARGGVLVAVDSQEFTVYSKKRWRERSKKALTVDCQLSTIGENRAIIWRSVRNRAILNPCRSRWNCPRTSPNVPTRRARRWTLSRSDAMAP